MKLKMALLGLLSLACTGCITRVKGVVLEDRTLRPVTNAVFSVGRHTGLGSYQTFRVNQKGEFDFNISPTDENYLYLWDGKGDPQVDMRRIDRSEINDHMKIILPWRGGE